MMPHRRSRRTASWAVMLELAAGDTRASIDLEAGGRLASLRIAEAELLLRDERPEFILPSATWGCYLMAPFAGRIRGGVVEYGGRRIAVPRNFGAHAIHGAVFDVPWEVERSSASAAALICEIDRVRWPFGGVVRQELILEPDSLRLSAEVTAADPMPASLGWHPWFRYRNGPVRLRLESGDTLETSPDLIPTGREIPVDQLTDLRAGADLRTRTLDDTYTRAVGPAVIAWPDLRLQIEFTPPLSAVVVHSPESGFCVEPQTAWPDAFRLSREGVRETGTVDLPAGGRLSASMRWSWQTER
jgi:aldose 1-epimerase